MADKKQDSTVVVVTGAQVLTRDGRVAAAIDLVEVGGGFQVVTVDGVPENREHPRAQLFHVRFLSPDRLISDELREAASYDDAVALGRAYAAKLDEHAERISALASDLKV
jgi:predicted NBD/HSP70 family sugar kinase